MGVHNTPIHPPQFVEYALNQFDSNAIINFFESLGVLHTIIPNGRIYPISFQASSVVNALRYESERLGIKTITDFEVISVEKKNNKFKIINKNKQSLICDKIIFASGSKTFGDLNNNIYKVLKSFGHTCTDLKPALVQLKTNQECVKGLQGVKVECELSLFPGK